MTFGKYILELVQCVFFSGSSLWKLLVEKSLLVKKMASDDPYKLFTVERDGKSLKLKEKQLTTVVLLRVFNLFPETILLVSEDGYVELPDEEGYFVAVDDLPTWTVTGDSMAPAPAAPPSTNMTTPYSYQPPLTGGRKNRGRKWSPMYRISLFQHQKPPGVCAQEADDYFGTSSRSRSTRVRNLISGWLS